MSKPTSSRGVEHGANAGPWRPSVARQAVWLFGLIALCFTAAGIGGAVTASSVGTWYRTLAKPRWTPPDWVFGPVWTLLYTMMAVSAWFVWRRCGWSAARRPLGVFGVQLALNVGWSFLFFGLRSPGLAFGELLILWLAIAATAVVFWDRSWAAALILVPYLAWTSFAGSLNLLVWRMNS